jgi:hypothetical protein
MASKSGSISRDPMAPGELVPIDAKACPPFGEHDRDCECQDPHKKINQISSTDQFAASKKANDQTKKANDQTKKANDQTKKAKTKETKETKMVAGFR